MTAGRTEAPPAGVRAEGAERRNSTRQVVVASLVGTSIEFYDFYVYATAAVLVFPHLFFPAGDDTAATLQSLATFAIAFVARPVGSALFGHFGDRIGRKATLVASLLTMGISTVLIGVLPTYQSIGVLAPLLLALCRFGQGLGLGGEWGGAALLATENAPPGRRALFGTFPQYGAPIGFFIANGLFLLLSGTMGDAAFLSWGWRIPFLVSAALVLVGLWVRLSLHETPAFTRVVASDQRARVPFARVFRTDAKAVLLGTFVMLATYVLFYLMTVFSLSYGTSAGGLGYERSEFLVLLLIGVVFFGLTIPVAGWCADRFGRRPALIATTSAIIAFGLLLGPWFGRGGVLPTVSFLVVGLALMGMTFGPMGAVLPELFPAAVRYTGASVSYNLASLLGASVAPYAATWLADEHGLGWVGVYLAAMGALTLLALIATRETRQTDIDR
ncbi:MFS transporter [Salinifilum aidingensis]